MTAQTVKRLELPEELLEHSFDLTLHGLIVLQSFPEKGRHFLEASGLLFHLEKPTASVSEHVETSVLDFS